MNRNQTLGWLLGGAVLAYLVYNRDPLAQFAESGVDSMTAALTGWKNVQQGPVWVPVINTTENQFGIPADLLARMAYQESSFKPEVISGLKVSRAGAAGILQMLPQYFASVNVPTPYTAADTVAQISEAAQYLQSLYAQFGDWGMALAAYNWGPTRMRQYIAGTAQMPEETANYVTRILADVPLPSSLLA